MGADDEHFWQIQESNYYEKKKMRKEKFQKSKNPKNRFRSHMNNKEVEKKLYNLSQEK